MMFGCDAACALNTTAVNALHVNSNASSFGSVITLSLDWFLDAACDGFGSNNFPNSSESMPSKYFAYPVLTNYAFASYRLGMLILILLFFRACSLASPMSDNRFFMTCLPTYTLLSLPVGSSFLTSNNRFYVPVSRKNC